MTDRETSGELEIPGVDFRRLFDEHSSYVWLSLRRLGVPDGDRDDAVQEVFTTVFDLLDDFDRSRPIRPWLFGITYRIALRHRRTFARRREDAHRDETNLPDRAPNPEEVLTSEQTRVIVAHAIEAIEIHRRAVFVMKEIDGHAVPDIAEALGLPLNTAYSRLRLARVDFAEAVERLKKTDTGAKSERRPAHA